MYTITYTFVHANGERMPTPLEVDRRSMKAVDAFIARLIAWCNAHGKTDLMTTVQEATRGGIR